MSSTTYYFRLVAYDSDTGAAEYGTLQTFTTGPPPVVTTTAATGVTGSAATINGTINPKGANGNWDFQWGTDPALNGYTDINCIQFSGYAYLGRCPLVTPNSTAQSFNASLSGLSNSSTYYYRIAVYDSDNGSYWYGGILSFTTAKAAQTIAFTDSLPASAVYAAGLTYPLSATGGASGNPVVFSIVSGPATVSGATLSITGAGTIVVAANQAGNATYAAAPQVTQTILITEAAGITSPTPGTTLSGSTVTFSWWAGAGVTQYQIRAGTTGAGSSDLLKLTTTALTSGLVSNIPVYGQTVYVTLYSMINKAWQYNSYTFTESGAPVLAALTSPTPGSTLTGSSATFNWTAGGAVTE